jgi:hypothetical protein
MKTPETERAGNPVDRHQRGYHDRLIRVIEIGGDSAEATLEMGTVLARQPFKGIRGIYRGLFNR